MNTIELVQLAKASQPAAFGDVPDTQAVGLVNAVLAELGRQIRETTEPVVLAGFGRFIVREVQVERGGQPATGRRVVFRLAPAPGEAPARPRPALKAAPLPGAAKKAAGKKAAGKKPAPGGAKASGDKQGD